MKGHQYPAGVDQLVVQVRHIPAARHPRRRPCPIITPLVRGEQYFLTPRNLTQVMLQGSINGIIALGMTFIITSGGIDLSVGSIVALAGVIAASVMSIGSGPWIGFGAAVATGILCGLFNGFLITRIKLQPFIATLGTMGIFRGLTLILSDGRPIYGFDSAFVDMFSQRVFGEIPLPVIVVAVLAAILLAGADEDALWQICDRHWQQRRIGDARWIRSGATSWGSTRLAAC